MSWASAMRMARSVSNIVRWRWTPALALLLGSLLFVALIAALVPHELGDFSSTKREARPFASSSVPSPVALPSPRHRTPLPPSGSVLAASDAPPEPQTGPEGVVPVIRDSEGRPLPPLVPHQDHVPIGYSPHLPRSSQPTGTP